MGKTMEAPTRCSVSVYLCPEHTDWESARPVSASAQPANPRREGARLTDKVMEGLHHWAWASQMLTKVPLLPGILRVSLASHSV